MKLKEKIFSMIGFEDVLAHCDVPCGIYDPINAQISALTVVRMMDQMQETQREGDMSVEHKNKMARLVQTKEEHAELAKHEIRIIWGDFIKAEHLEKYPNLHVLVHEIMQAGSKSRQTVDRKNGELLLEKINEFAKIFWEIKGYEVVTEQAPYAPNLPVVYRKQK